MVNRLLITALMAAALTLAPGHPAPAQTGVEYGVVVHNGSRVSQAGSPPSQAFKPAPKKVSSRKRTKAKR